MSSSEIEISFQKIAKNLPFFYYYVTCGFENMSVSDDIDDWKDELLYSGKVWKLQTSWHKTLIIYMSAPAKVIDHGALKSDKNVPLGEIALFAKSNFVEQISPKEAWGVKKNIS